MKSLWSDQEAARYAGDLGQCVYVARLLGAADAPLIQAGTSASVKIAESNVFGEERDVLYVTAKDRDLANTDVRDFRPMRLRRLGRLARVPGLSEQALASEIEASAVAVDTPVVFPDILLHAVLPYTCVHHVFPSAVLALAATPDGLERLAQVLDGVAAVIPYVKPGQQLAQECADVVASRAEEGLIGLVVMHHGLVSFGEHAKESYERLIEMTTRVEEHVAQRAARPASRSSVDVSDTSMRAELAALRQSVSASAGVPMILSTVTDSQTVAFARRNDIGSIVQRGPVAPQLVLWTRARPMIGRDVTAFEMAYREHVAAKLPEGVSRPVQRDLSPRVIFDPQFGLSTVGRTAQEAGITQEITCRAIQAMLTAESLGGYQPAATGDVLDLEYSELARARMRLAEKHRMFSGEVAVVTGAASGIGKACVQSFLARGAAVVGLDINPQIVDLFGRPDYLGICCDLTDEDAVCDAFERTVRAFGGVDMLVPNAGIFPPGCPIASLKTSDWRKVMSINLDANLVLFREAYPMLKAAPRNGRVAVMSSRNVPAPGPGAVAYSASKAALTQIARVAALEWGKDGIRVNMLNPHAVFDTGIWTDEVLKARAAHYGLTVEQYKRNNVLRVEITSHDVGELVAEMCGPLFDKSTGAQVPIDGGSDRVI
jgi:rhamnose utilization protein RhaD (predicted bifunctional aldolase and dehydrogenase)/NAD(P)-dependent dehydrogenase (short-subunit alcohol dehydrogenase family)